MHRTLFILLFGLIITAMPATGFAQSEDTPIAGASAVYCPQLSQTMVRGARDRTTVPPGQVTELQKFISDYYDVDPDDIVTGYFGALTHGHVVRFQREQNLPAFGIVGPLTRAAIARACSVSAAPAAQSCKFDGQTVPSGSSVVAYQAASVPPGGACVSERRYCVLGTLTGSYGYATCTVGSNFTEPPIPVLSFSSKDAKVAPGKQTTLTWSATNATWCSAGGGWSGTKATSGTQETTALWGATTFTLACFGSGSLASTTKSVTVAVIPEEPPQKRSCTQDGVTIEHGASRIFYSTRTADNTNACNAASELRTCTDGTLSGSRPYASCTPNPTTPEGTAYRCDFNGQIIADGESVTAYAASTVPYGGQCKSETRTCIKGVLTGSYMQRSCTVASAESPQSDTCSFNGQTVANGASIVAYQASSVPAGGSCKSETRTCFQGVLTGSYGNATCTVGTTTPQTGPVTDANCEPFAPGASEKFGVQPPTGPAPLSVTVSFGGHSLYRWDGFDFGDGTKLDPVWDSPLVHVGTNYYRCTRHTYTTPGTYTITQTNYGVPVTSVFYRKTVTVY